jgi:hypothetical protein
MNNACRRVASDRYVGNHVTRISVRLPFETGVAVASAGALALSLLAAPSHALYQAPSISVTTRSSGASFFSSFSVSSFR